MVSPNLKCDCAFIDARHEAPNPFVWTKTADAILMSVGRFACHVRAQSHN